MNDPTSEPMLITPRKRVRFSPEMRKASIVARATEMAEEKGYKNYSSLELAKACGLRGHSLIFHHFSSMDHVREEVMRKAIADENLKILGQGIANDDKVAQSAPERLKLRAVNALK